VGVACEHEAQRRARKAAGRATGSNVVESPVRQGHLGRDSINDLVLALATAGDLACAMAHLADWLGRASGVSRVEWWRNDEDDAPELVAAAGSPRARRHDLPLGPAGVFVLHGGRLDAQAKAALLSLGPILRRHAAEERLTRTAMQLARRNEALEDFAALVAHELKAPLHAALVADDPAAHVGDALKLVDGLLQAAQKEPSERTFASAAEALNQVVGDIRSEVVITADLATALPLPPEPLRVLLRNLLANAAAAGAHRVHVTAERSSGSFRLLVDDDGAGLVDVDRYAAGNGLGLSLCARIASRFGGQLQLAPHASGGTRATLEFFQAPR
jgi:signal transduction histidine kinase